MKQKKQGGKMQDKSRTPVNDMCPGGNTFPERNSRDFKHFCRRQGQCSIPRHTLD